MILLKIAIGLATGIALLLRARDIGHRHYLNGFRQGRDAEIACVYHARATFLRATAARLTADSCEHEVTR